MTESFPNLKTKKTRYLGAQRIEGLKQDELKQTP